MTRAHAMCVIRRFTQLPTELISCERKLAVSANERGKVQYDLTIIHKIGVF
jgi:hypothetical protein